LCTQRFRDTNPELLSFVYEQYNLILITLWKNNLALKPTAEALQLTEQELVSTIGSLVRKGLIFPDFNTELSHKTKLVIVK